MVGSIPGPGLERREIRELRSGQRACRGWRRQVWGLQGVDPLVWLEEASWWVVQPAQEQVLPVRELLWRGL